MRFILACRDDNEGLAKLCRRFGISRPTAYKWLERYAAEGPSGLVARAPIAKVAPHRVAGAVVDAIVELRKERHTWGPKKLRARLQEKRPELVLPATSTISEILREHGLVRVTRRRPRIPIEQEPLGDPEFPNDLWCADFKGQFRLGDRRYCYPLTISDHASRFVLKSEGLLSTNEKGAFVHFERAFNEFGLPTRMRTDNGVPFARLAAGGLSRLSVWWIKLGITPERIDPGEPQQNGRHERMHRTMKAEVLTTKTVSVTKAVGLRSEGPGKCKRRSRIDV